MTEQAVSDLLQGPFDAVAKPLARCLAGLLSSIAPAFELTRRCQTAFREAKGRPITADEIAVQAMKEKNLDMGDGALRQDITRRFMWTLTRMLKTGGVSKQGWGADAKWAMQIADR